jgi:CheY-like chemotaxis protein
MTKSDFANLHVMLVGAAAAPGLTIVRTLLGIVGIVRIVRVEHTGEALTMLGAAPFSAVFCAHSCVVEGVPFAAAVRRLPARKNPAIPVFVLKERAARRDVEKLRDLGATDVLTMPISPRTLTRKLAAAVQAPRTFVDVPGFQGPDRRSRGRKPFGGQDRRARVPGKARIDLILG